MIGEMVAVPSPVRVGMSMFRKSLCFQHIVKLAIQRSAIESNWIHLNLFRFTCSETENVVLLDRSYREVKNHWQSENLSVAVHLDMPRCSHRHTLCWALQQSMYRTGGRTNFYKSALDLQGDARHSTAPNFIASTGRGINGHERRKFLVEQDAMELGRPDDDTYGLVHGCHGCRRACAESGKTKRVSQGAVARQHQVHGGGIL